MAREVHHTMVNETPYNWNTALKVMKTNKWEITEKELLRKNTHASHKLRNRCVLQSTPSSADSTRRALKSRSPRFSSICSRIRITTTFTSVGKQKRRSSMTLCAKSKIQIRSYHAKWIKTRKRNWI